MAAPHSDRRGRPPRSALNRNAFAFIPGQASRYPSARGRLALGTRALTLRYVSHLPLAYSAPAIVHMKPQRGSEGASSRASAGKMRMVIGHAHPARPRPFSTLSPVFINLNIAAVGQRRTCSYQAVVVSKNL